MQKSSSLPSTAANGRLKTWTQTPNCIDCEALGVCVAARKYSPTQTTRQYVQRIFGNKNNVWRPLLYSAKNNVRVIIVITHGQDLVHPWRGISVACARASCGVRAAFVVDVKTLYEGKLLIEFNPLILLLETLALFQARSSVKHFLLRVAPSPSLKRLFPVSNSQHSTPASALKHSFSRATSYPVEFNCRYHFGAKPT